MGPRCQDSFDLTQMALEVPPEELQPLIPVERTRDEMRQHDVTDLHPREQLGELRLESRVLPQPSEPVPERRPALRRDHGGGRIDAVRRAGEDLVDAALCEAGLQRSAGSVLPEGLTGLPQTPDPVELCAHQVLDDLTDGPRAWLGPVSGDLGPETPDAGEHRVTSLLDLAEQPLRISWRSWMIQGAPLCVTSRPGRVNSASGTR